jgi:hypothetical protein
MCITLFTDAFCHDVERVALFPLHLIKGETYRCIIKFVRGNKELIIDVNDTGISYVIYAATCLLTVVKTYVSASQRIAISSVWRTCLSTSVCNDTGSFPC